MVSSPGRLLLRTCHLGPTLVVTTLSVLLGVAHGLPLGRIALLAVAVLTGQLTIGWSNDVIDAARDRQVGRRDKPLAAEPAAARLVRGALLVAGLVCLVASVALGAGAAATHLVLVVGAGWAYNLGLKRTVWSVVPYVCAFGSLPHVVSLSDPAGPALAPWWWGAVGGLLGVAAHLLNVLPDLDADAATSVAGFPHRLGESGLRILAAATVAGSFVIIAAMGRPGILGTTLAGALVLAAVPVAVRGRGPWPFRAVLAVAVLDVALLVLTAAPPAAA